MTMITKKELIENLRSKNKELEDKLEAGERVIACARARANGHLKRVIHLIKNALSFMCAIKG